MKTPHWGRDAQVLYSCVRNTGASRQSMPPLSGPHSASKTLCSVLLLCAVLPHPSLLELHVRDGQPALWSVCVCVCVSSNPGCALGAVGYLGAGDVVMWSRCPEENVINHQYESGHRHAEEIDNRHRHFHPNLCWHVGVFGPQLPGIARPPLHVPVQLLGGRGDLSASRFHVGRLWKPWPTLTNDVSPDSCLFIRVRTAEPAAPPLFPSTTLFWSWAGAGWRLSHRWAVCSNLPKACLQEVNPLVPLRAQCVWRKLNSRRMSLISAGRDRRQNNIA